VFCPECEAEYREGFTECSDCGVALVATLEPRRAEEIVEGLTPVMETKDGEELALVVDRLEKAGVPYVIEAGSALALLDGRDEELPQPWQARLSVATELMERAEKIVLQVRRPHRPHRVAAVMTEVDCRQHHAILAVRDVRAAVDFYTEKLGFWCAFIEGEPPHFAGVNLGEVQIFLERGNPGSGDCGVYFVVSDADALYALHRANGVEVVEPIDNRDYGLRDYSVRDLDGYRLSFGQRT
jgi:catechol 2,3-dioxygenase-like lactoylglutathione lyase family enzyme